MDRIITDRDNNTVFEANLAEGTYTIHSENLRVECEGGIPVHPLLQSEYEGKQVVYLPGNDHNSNALFLRYLFDHYLPTEWAKDGLRLAHND
ncbi:MAG: hypothetical protein KDK76_07750 [Chlamydiia bacterium]|nr:hypothetical protein [Chlamydiia bacterium]